MSQKIGWLALLALLALPAPAWSHELISRHGAFLGPALHIFSEVDHLAAFAVVGLLAGQNTARVRTAGLAAFAAALVLALLAAQGLADAQAFDAVEPLLSAGSMLVIGVLVAIDWRLQVWQIVLTAAAVGLVHGMANGLAIAATPQLGLSILGAVIAACLIAAIGTLLSTGLQGPRVRIAVRVLGSWVAALGLMLIGLALRG